MTFADEVSKRLSLINQDVLSYSETKFLTTAINYRYVEEYAVKNELINTMITLNLCRGFLSGKREDKPYDYIHDHIGRIIYFSHCLFTTRILIDLHPEVSQYEEDIMLSVALGHVLIEKIDFINHGDELIDLYGIDPEVLKLIRINKRNHTNNKEDEKQYYKQIQKNKLALLVKLADRGNIVEQLFDADTKQIQHYLQDTKENFIPMCIYGKTHYPELNRVFNIQMSKMKFLVDIIEILTSKHMNRVSSYNSEIISLKEDNAKLKKMMQELKKG